jgi:hypothetical protein
MIKNSVIGWREIVSLPDLGIRHIKAKIDTGARTSSLHAKDINIIQKGGKEYIQFWTNPINKGKGILLEAQLHCRQNIINLGTQYKQRPVIHTCISIGDITWFINLNLVDRGPMDYRILIGRQAISGKFLVNAGKSYTLLSQPSRKYI